MKTVSVVIGLLLLGFYSFSYVNDGGNTDRDQLDRAESHQFTKQDIKNFAGLFDWWFGGDSNSDDSSDDSRRELTPADPCWHAPPHMRPSSSEGPVLSGSNKLAYFSQGNGKENAGFYLDYTNMLRTVPAKVNEAQEDLLILAGWGACMNACLCDGGDKSACDAVCKRL